MRFPDVPVSQDLSKCVKCHRAFEAQDRIAQIVIVTGVDPEARPGFRLFCMDTSEYGHVDCTDRRILRGDPRIQEIQRQRLTMESNIQPLRPRFNEYTCAVCRKRVVRGDRIIMAALVEGIGKDPETGAAAPLCSAEFEVAHCRCDDPQLTGGPGVLVVGHE